MKYSVCTDALFPQVSPKSYMLELKSCGCTAIEFWSWWDKDIESLAEMCRRNDMKIAAFCTRFNINPGIPQNHDSYLSGLADSIKAAAALGCSTLIAQAGWTAAGIPFEVHRNALIQVLKDAVPLLSSSKITLALEPLNTKTDHPGYHLSYAEDAFDLIRTLNTPHIKVLYDIYHQQITEGNIIQTITQNIDLIAHFHIAAVPGRTEPLYGELNYPYIIKKIKETGYTGYIGLEYMPHRSPIRTLRETLDVFHQL